jgi:hypothetical protein
LLKLGALDGMKDGAYDKVGCGLTLGTILVLGLLEAEGADDCVGLNDKVGFCDGKFDGASLVLGMLEAVGAELGRLDSEGTADGSFDGDTLGAPLGVLETVGLEGLYEAVGCPLVFSR